VVATIFNAVVLVVAAAASGQSAAVQAVLGVSVLALLVGAFFVAAKALRFVA